MIEYRPCFERDTARRPPVLTARDRELILACFHHQGLTRPQLQRIVGMPGVTRINQRLRQLYDGRYLERLRVGTVGAGMQPIYLAGEAAVPLIAVETDRDPSLIREWLREDARASATFLPHDLEVNDVRIALTAAIEADPQLQLRAWENARTCYNPYAEGRVLRPDGYLRFSEGDMAHNCFLEVDRSTMNLARWGEKVQRYLDFRASGAFREHYHFEQFRVLVTVPTAVRLAHLVAATRKVTDRSFWFAVTGELLIDADCRRPIWQPVGQGGRRALCEGTGR